MQRPYGVSIIVVYSYENRCNRLVKSGGVRSQSSGVRRRENYKDLVVMRIGEFFYVQSSGFDITYSSNRVINFWLWTVEIFSINILYLDRVLRPRRFCQVWSSNQQSASLLPPATVALANVNSNQILNVYNGGDSREAALRLQTPTQSAPLIFQI